MTDRTKIILPASTVLTACKAASEVWFDHGGQERTQVSIIAKHKSLLTEQWCGRTIGFLWCKRPLTGNEILERVERDWDEDFRPKYFAHIELNRINEQAVKAQRLVNALTTVPPDTEVSIEPKLWLFVNTVY